MEYTCKERTIYQNHTTDPHRADVFWRYHLTKETGNII